MSQQQLGTDAAQLYLEAQAAQKLENAAEIADKAGFKPLADAAHEKADEAKAKMQHDAAHLEKEAIADPKASIEVAAKLGFHNDKEMIRDIEAAKHGDANPLANEKLDKKEVEFEARAVMQHNGVTPHDSRTAVQEAEDAWKKVQSGQVPHLMGGDTLISEGATLPDKHAKLEIPASPTIPSDPGMSVGGGGDGHDPVAAMMAQLDAIKKKMGGFETTTVDHDRQQVASFENTVLDTSKKLITDHQDLVNTAMAAAPKEIQPLLQQAEDIVLHQGGSAKLQADPNVKTV